MVRDRKLKIRFDVEMLKAKFKLGNIIEYSTNNFVALIYWVVRKYGAIL